MKIEQGGTKMFCSRCGQITVCKVISPSEIRAEANARRVHRRQVDIHWFRRVRECQECGLRFTTAELQSSFIDELVEKRERVQHIDASSERVRREAHAAAAALHRLHAALADAKVMQPISPNEWIPNLPDIVSRLAAPVASMIPSRIASKLERAGYRSLWDLLGVSREELVELEIGLRWVNKIESELRELGVALGQTKNF